MDSKNKKYKYIYTVWENNKPIVKMHSKRLFDACYIVDGLITLDGAKAKECTTFAYTFTYLYRNLTTICNLYTT